MTVQPDPLALAGELDDATILAGLSCMATALDAKGLPNAALYMRVAANHIALAALRTDQDARPAAEGVRERLPFDLIAEGVWRLHVPEAKNWAWGTDVSRYYSDKYDVASRALVSREKIAAALAQTDAVAAAMAERESDGEPYWVDRFGDNVAPERN